MRAKEAKLPLTAPGYSVWLSGQSQFLDLVTHPFGVLGVCVWCVQVRCRGLPAIGSPWGIWLGVDSPWVQLSVIKQPKANSPYVIPHVPTPRGRSKTFMLIKRCEQSLQLAPQTTLSEWIPYVLTPCECTLFVHLPNEGVQLSSSTKHQ